MNSSLALGLEILHHLFHMASHLVSELEVILRLDEDENLVDFDWIGLIIVGGECNIDLVLASIDCFNVCECKVIEVAFTRRDTKRISLQQLYFRLAVSCWSINLDPQSNYQLVGLFQIQLK